MLTASFPFHGGLVSKQSLFDFLWVVEELMGLGLYEVGDIQGGSWNRCHVIRECK